MPRAALMSRSLLALKPRSERVIITKRSKLGCWRPSERPRICNNPWAIRHTRDGGDGVRLTGAPAPSRSPLDAAMAAFAKTWRSGDVRATGADTRSGSQGIFISLSLSAPLRGGRGDLSDSTRPRIGPDVTATTEKADHQ